MNNQTTNHNNSASANQQLFGIQQYVEPSLFQNKSSNPLKNLRIPNYEILNFVALGAIVIYLLYTR